MSGTGDERDMGEPNPDDRLSDGSTKAPGAAGLLCPSCGSPKPLRIAYGYPSAEMFEAAMRGELTLGGCIVERESPTLSCRLCGFKWGAPPRQIDGLAAYFPGRSSRTQT